MTTLHTWTRLVAALFLAVGVLFAVGCDSAGTSSSSAAEGSFTLRLTDAPAALDSAVVTVDRVELVGDDAEDDEESDNRDDDNGDDDNGDDDNGDDSDDGDDNGADDDGEDDGEGSIALTDETRKIDLLQLQDGNTALLADGVTVPKGEYSQLRFVLGDENYIVVDGSKQSLEVPGGQQSGITDT
jgi:hypothetical protein